MTQRAPMDVRIHDSSLHIWQDDARDETFNQVFRNIIAGFWRRGWTVTADPTIHYRSLRKTHRVAERGNLRAAIEIFGRHIEIKYWATTWPLDNRNGPRYDYDKLRRMEYLDQMRVRLEHRKLLAFAQGLGPVKLKADPPANEKAMDRINRDYATSCHSTKALGRPVPSGPSNETSKDGLTIVHGETVWFIDDKGRIGRGTAYYNLNNAWYIVNGETTLHKSWTHDIFVNRPDDLRRKRNDRARRGRLEGQLQKAVARMDFRRAELLKGILFGNEQTFLIWARDKQAWYRSNYSGYTSDRLSAGRYTREEATREVKRVSHELEAHGPDGEVIRFDEQVAA